MANDFDNPFSQLNRNLREVPPEMTIAKLILDMAILVTSNYSSLFAGLFRTNKKSNQQP